MNYLKLKPLLLASLMMAVGAASAADPLAASEKDPLRSSLMESREKNRGVTLHVAGANIAMVVTALDMTYVVGRSQAAGRIVVRLDRIDGISAAQ